MMTAAVGTPAFSAVPDAKSKRVQGITKSRQKDTAGWTDRQAPTATGESISVQGARRINGVTNTTPGGGLMPVQTAPRSQSGLTRDFIAKQPPTSNINTLVAALPGAISAVQDPLGINGADMMNIRGLTITQLGYAFEGAPIADPISYQPFTAMHVDTENLGSVTLSQGSVDIDQPFYNAVGGEVSAKEINPSNNRGIFLEGLGGTHSANKEFVRLNTGQIGHSGVRGFTSFSHTSGNSWRGPGGYERYHVDAKFVRDWGGDNTVSAVFGFNRMKYTNLLTPTLDQWRQYGRSYNSNK